MQTGTHSAARWDWVDSFGSQVSDAWNSLKVPLPKITLLDTKTSNPGITPDPPPPPSCWGPDPARAPSLPSIVAASTTSFRDQFRLRSLSVPTTNTFPTILEVGKAVTYPTLQSGEATPQATSQTAAPRAPPPFPFLRGAALPSRGSGAAAQAPRGGDVPARSLLAELQWEEAWLKMRRAENPPRHAGLLAGLCGPRALSPTERKAVEQASARRAARVAGQIRRASFSGSSGVGVQPLAALAVLPPLLRTKATTSLAANPNGKAAYVPHRRGSM
ncbi:hypothetical protein T484DRAFT_1823436 [Baffinella frigidus]|nr:hypothetical protein T484DRAFT_1823436 [Cryptophyta sp. CCMP2293]